MNTGSQCTSSARQRVLPRVVRRVRRQAQQSRRLGRHQCRPRCRRPSSSRALRFVCAGSLDSGTDIPVRRSKPSPCTGAATGSSPAGTAAQSASSPLNIQRPPTRGPHPCRCSLHAPPRAVPRTRTIMATIGGRYPAFAPARNARAPTLVRVRRDASGSSVVSNAKRALSYCAEVVVSAASRPWFKGTLAATVMTKVSAAHAVPTTTHENDGR